MRQSAFVVFAFMASDRRLFNPSNPIPAQGMQVSTPLIAKRKLAEAYDLDS
jgi:hypothetical protein